MHALSGLPSDVAFEPDGSMSLRFLPDFLAKNQLPGSPSPIISIKSLTSILAPDDEDRSLCPVRALRAYRKRTESFRSKRRRLLLSWNENYKDDIRRSTISRWLREDFSCLREAQVGISCLFPKASRNTSVGVFPGICQQCILKQPYGCCVLEVSGDLHPLLPAGRVPPTGGRIQGHSICSSGPAVHLGCLRPFSVLIFQTLNG